MSSFDPTVYTSQMFDSDKGHEERDRFLLFESDALNEIYKREEIKGDRLLDIGTGPVVNHVFFAGKKFEHLYLSDVLDENLAVLRKWKQGEINLQESLFNHLIKLEGSDKDWITANRRLANQVAAIVPYDLNQDNPLSGSEADGLQFDVISLCMCQNIAASSAQTYQTAIENYSKLLKPGGHVIVADTLSEPFSKGICRMKQFNATKDNIQAMYIGSGFEVVTWSPFDKPEWADHFPGVSGAYVMLAKKEF